MKALGLNKKVGESKPETTAEAKDELDDQDWIITF
jgi:hypothetical protein